MEIRPLVSVIVPVHNGEPYIGMALDSALTQTYRDIEIIVVDDGSSDGTLASVQARAACDSRVRMISQANQGVAAARNRAIAESIGEFIAPLDADDLWEPTKIERQVRRMRETGAETGLVYTWWICIDSDGAVFDSSPRWRVEGDGGNGLIQVNYTGNASVPLFRKREVEAVGGYNETLRHLGAEGCEDVDLALKISERSRVVVEPAMLVGYRRQADSMSTGLDRMWRSYRLVLDSAQRRRGGLPASCIRRAEDQFALYLAGIAFVSGNYGHACSWGMRTLRSRIGYEVLPYVARGIGRMSWLRKPSHALIVRPGVPFAHRSFPGPRIPYDRIYAGRL